MTDLGSHSPPQSTHSDPESNVTETDTAASNPQVETSVSTGQATPVAMGTMAPPVDTQSHYVVEEEFTIGVPLVRPTVPFLEVLKMVGASGEVFTKKEICQYLKAYIGSRQLYDADDPRVVHCGNNQLGTVFGVDSFTIDDVLDLLTKHCTQVPDTCLKRKRHLVRRPLPPWSTARAHTQPSVTVAVCRSSPIITSTTSYRKPRKSHSSVSDDDTLAAVLQNNPSISPRKKKPRSRKKSKSDVNGVAANNNIDTSVIKIPVDPVLPSNTISCDQDLGSSCTSTEGQTEEKCSESTVNVKTAEDEKAKKRKQQGPTDDAGSQRKRHRTEPASRESSSPGQSSRRRGTSLSITIPSDVESSSYPWYLELEMANDGDDDDDAESEVLSIQSHETATVQDSVDDLWFVEEESVTVEMDSDTEFSVEYEVDSDTTQLTDSDIGSVKSGEGGFFVVCQESDVEFFADYSDSDSEASSDVELTEADKWTCLECSMVNPPYQRYCNRCWKLRTGWLPDAGVKASIRSKSKYFVTSSSDNESVQAAGDNNRCRNLKQSSANATPMDANIPALKLMSNSMVSSEAFDSGIGGFSSPQPSSQETVKSSVNCSQESAAAESEVIDKNRSYFLEMEPKELALDSIELVSKMADKLTANYLKSVRKSKTDIFSTADAKDKPNSVSAKASSLHVLSNPKSLMVNQTSLLTESPAMEVRHSYSNFRSNQSALSQDSPINGHGRENKQSDIDQGSKVVSSPLSDPCIICLSKPKTASLIHGSSGHQVCCFTCAKRLKRRGKVCPVCRRPIQKVVKNYIL